MFHILEVIDILLDIPISFEGFFAKKKKNYFRKSH